MLGDLQDNTAGVILDFQCVENGRQVARVELDVDDGTNDGADLTVGTSGFGSEGADYRVCVCVSVCVRERD